jgi:hypothetical protein
VVELGRGLTGALSEAMAPTRDAAAIKASMASGSRIRPSTEAARAGERQLGSSLTRPVVPIGASRPRVSSARSPTPQRSSARAFSSSRTMTVSVG